MTTLRRVVERKLHGRARVLTTLRSVGPDDTTSRHDPSRTTLHPTPRDHPAGTLHGQEEPCATSPSSPPPSPSSARSCSSAAHTATTTAPTGKHGYA